MRAIRHPHDGGAGPAIVAGQEPQEDTDDRGDENHRDTDHERNAAAVDDAAQGVAAQGVRAQPVLCVRLSQRVAGVELVGREGSKERSKDGHEDQEHEHDEADQHDLPSEEHPREPLPASDPGGRARQTHAFGHGGIGRKPAHVFGAVERRTGRRRKRRAGGKGSRYRGRAPWSSPLSCSGCADRASHRRCRPAGSRPRPRRPRSGPRPGCRGSLGSGPRWWPSGRCRGC